MSDTTRRGPVVLDCDPGHDDAFAMLLAHAGLDLRAITTVAGNQTLAKVTDNARRVATLAGIRDVPIAAGAARPLVREPTIAGDVHGASGLDGAELPDPDVPLHDEPATDLLTRLAAEQPLTVIATGPLTNVALLIRALPDPSASIREIVLMGGSTGRGNTRPYAEFNIYVDPEAAAEVFASGLPITMIGLDVTHQALATDEVRRRIGALGTPVATTLGGLLDFFATTYERLWGRSDPPLHDPVAVAYVIDRDVVECVDTSVAIETVGEHTRGATVVDLYGRTGQPVNARVGTRLDVARFWDLLVDAVAAHG